MLHLTINKQRRKLITDWHDLPLNVAMKAATVELPNVEAFDDWFKYPEKVHELMNLFSDFEPFETHWVTPTELTYFFTKYVLPLIQDLKGDYPKTYEPKGITHFNHKGKTYIMPKTLAIGTNQILQHNTKVRPFIEASNLLKAFAEMKSEGIKVMPYFCAAIVKESENEYYSDELIAARGNEFADLPMDIVWECFFFTQQHIIRLMSDILKSTLAQVKRAEALSGTKVGRWLLRILGFVELLRK
jgi:hypothetical protein